MTKRLALLSLLLLPLMACTKPSASADNAASADTARAETDAPMQQPPAADPAAPDAATADATTAAPADDAAMASPATDMPAAASTPPASLVEGVDYETIPNGQPFAPLNGKVEVAEVFSYVCPACAAFEPLLSAWKSKLPANVRFTYVPAAFGQRWDPYVRAYYAAESMGVADKAHGALFNAIHVERSLKGELGDDSPEDIANFYAKYGVDPKQFVSTMASFAVDGRYNRAKQFILRGQVNSTPTLVIDGKYKVKGKNFTEMLDNASALIASEQPQAGN